MNDNEKIIRKFYTAFQSRDYQTMGECYAADARFSDEAFINLDALQTKAMWKMLCVKGKDLELNFQNVSANETGGSCEWIAKYTFSVTGKRVENHIKAEFMFANGQIIRHTDSFNFYKWSSQALGITGILLGWTPILKNKVRATALKNLEDFIANEKG
jgi:ketosteroid isomerase-like protein